MLQTKQRVKEEEINTDKDGKTTKAFLSSKIPLYKESGEVYGLCGVSTDITERKKYEDEMKFIAFHDPLTRLPNRLLFDDRLKNAMNQSKRTRMYSGVVFLDLDNFKPLNDEYGHDVGDLLLIDAAKRLESLVREVDTVARFGGDEFVVLLNNLGQEVIGAKNIAMEICQKILVHLSEPYQLNIHRNNNLYKIEHLCTASIGVTLFIGDEVSKEEIIVNADKAMYTSKEHGRNRIHFYE